MGGGGVDNSPSTDDDVPLSKRISYNRDAQCLNVLSDSQPQPVSMTSIHHPNGDITTPNWAGRKGKGLKGIKRSRSGKY